MRSEPEKDIEEGHYGQRDEYALGKKKRPWNSMKFVGALQAVQYYSSKQHYIFAKVEMLGDRTMKKFWARFRQTEKEQRDLRVI